MPRVCLGLLALLGIGQFIPLTVAQNQPSSYSLQTLAGGDYVGDDGPAAGALLLQVEGVASDARGNIYLADSADHRVRRIGANGVISTFAGTGHPGFSGDGAPAAAAQLRNPYGVAVDRNGNVYIADLGNGRIRRVTADGLISTYAGGGTAAPAQSDGMPATNIALSAPRNVAVDVYGVLYFSDFGAHRVYQVSPSGVLNGLAGTGDAGYTGDGGPAVRAQLSAPAGVAVDPAGTVYIADTGNARVRKLFRGVISTLGDGGVAGAKPVFTVVMPVGLAIDPDGSLFIADAGANQMLRVTPALASTPIAQPARDIAIDTQGNLFASSGPLVYRRPRGGDSMLIAGAAASSYGGDGGPLLRARFAQPGGIARDGAGNLYVADTGHHRVRKIGVDGTIQTIAGSGSKGFGGDGGPAIAAQLDSPVGVAVDISGAVYIGDTGNHRVRKIDVLGNISTLAGTGVRGHSPDGTLSTLSQLDTPTWLAIYRTGDVYVSETGGHAVRVITPGGQLGTIAGVGTAGYTGDGGAASSASLNSPTGIAIDAAGGIYIADSGNRRTRYVTPPTSAGGSSTIATVPDTTAAIWRGARGLALDAQGSLYLADAVDARVFRIDSPGRVLSIAGTGATGFMADSGPGLGQMLDTPSGIAVDPGGNVYLVDSGNGRIRKLTPTGGSAPPPGPPAQPNIAVVSAASLQAGLVSPGELVSVFGAGLGPAGGLSASQPIAELGGTQVLFNGRVAPLSFVGQNQINLQVPYSLGDTRPCDVQVLSGGIVKARASVNVVDSAPAIFTTGGGTGQAAALNEDGSINSADNPADRGSVIVLFATGEGQTYPAGIEGRPAGTPAPTPVLPVSVQIGSYYADVLYAGAAPGFAGLLQVNARVPGGFAPPGTLPVTVQVGAVNSQSGVTLSVR